MGSLFYFLEYHVFSLDWFWVQEFSDFAFPGISRKVLMCPEVSFHPSGCLVHLQLTFLSPMTLYLIDSLFWTIVTTEWKFGHSIVEHCWQMLRKTLLYVPKKFGAYQWFHSSLVSCVMLILGKTHDDSCMLGKEIDWLWRELLNLIGTYVTVNNLCAQGWGWK